MSERGEKWARGKEGGSNSGCRTNSDWEGKSQSAPIVWIGTKHLSATLLSGSLAKERSFHWLTDVTTPPASTHPFIVVSLHAQSGETSNCPNVSRASLGRFSSSGQTSSHRAVLRPSAVFIWEVSFTQFVVYRLGFSAGSSICLCMDRDHHSGSVNHSASEYKPNLVRANWRTSKKTWQTIIQ